MEQLLDRQVDHKICLYWGIRREVIDMVDKRLRLWEQQSPRFHYQLWASQPEVTLSQRRQGRITESVIGTLATLDQPTYYLCGNGSMVTDVSAGLAARGCGRNRIRAESFYFPPAPVS